MSAYEVQRVQQPKHPDDVDFNIGIDCEAHIAGDSIAAVTGVAVKPEGLTVVDYDLSGAVIRVLLSNGRANVDYIVTAVFILASGTELNRSVVVGVRDI